MRRFCLVMVLAAWGLPAMARLGETEAESRARYGEPLRSTVRTLSPMVPGTTEQTYNFDGWRIVAGYHQDRTVAIRYSKIATPDQSLHLKDDEMQAVLAGEAGDGKWKAVGAGLNPLKLIERAKARTTVWKNSNGRTAILESTSLFLELPEADDLRKAAKERAEKRRNESGTEN